MSWDDPLPTFDDGARGKFDIVVKRLAAAPGDRDAQVAANALALDLEDRCMERAMRKFDFGPDYQALVDAIAQLVKLAGEQADPRLKKMYSAI